MSIESRTVGRAHELRIIDAWRHAAGSGSGSALVLEGGAGSGKTHLLDEVNRAARSAGDRIHWLRAHPNFGAAPYLLWRPLATAVSPGGVDVASTTARVEFFEAILDSLVPTTAAPVFVLLDDVHWADTDSVELLSYAVHSLHRLPVHLLIAARPTWADEPWGGVRDDLVREPWVDLLTLDGLDESSTAALFARAADQLPDGEATQRLQGLTGGNPLFVLELARAARRGGNWTRSTTVAQVMAANLAQLGDDTATIVGSAAVISEQFREGTLAAALGRPLDDIRSALEQAANAGIIRRAEIPGEWRFDHALAHDACLATFDTAARASLHAQIAGVLEADLGASAAEVAWHYLAATDTAPAIAARWATRAATEALEAFAFDDAANWIERAIGCGGTDEEIAELLAEQAHAWWMCGRHDACMRAVDEAIERAVTAGRLEIAARAALVPEPTGHIAWDLWITQNCARVLDAVDPTCAELRARLHARRAEALLYAADDAGAGQESTLAVSAADECGTPVAVTAALRARQLIASGPEHHDERVALADRMISTGVAIRRPDVEMWGRLWQLDTHWERGDPAAVSHDLPRLRWCAERTGGARSRWHLLVARAALEAAQARFDDATTTAREAFELAARTDIAAGLGAYMNLLGVVGHHVGHDRAMSTIPEGIDGDEPVDDGEVRDHIFSYLGPAVAMAEAGRLDLAAALYRGAGPPATWRPPPYLRVPAWANGLLVAIPLGLEADVSVLCDRLDAERHRSVVVGAGVAAYGGPVELYLGKAAAHLGDLDRAAEDLTTALDHAVPHGLPGFETEACIELADALRRRNGPGDARQAAEHAGRAAGLARRYGMTPWQRRAEHIQQELNREAAQPLTRREREVADLVARGLTNRQIAEALYISERTAQTHVQHILTKLGFSARAQIATWITAAAIAR